ncbi:MAG: PD40 domain-containing protein [Armatimonadetes bacterium]|nr:PD40 domain-containing protein [Armatimonadota bacterium]
MTTTACRVCLALLALLPCYAVADESAQKGGPGMIVYSVRHWEGDFSTDNGPPTPFTSAIYTVPADGAAEPRRVIDVEGRGDAPRFSPDGRWIYFQAPHGGHHQIHRCRTDGSALQDLTGGLQPAVDRFGCQLSRDGTKLAYIEHDGQTGRVGIMNADGSAPHLIAPDIGYHYMAELSPDNRSVAFAHTAQGYVLALLHLDTGELTSLKPDLPDSYCPQFTPDGRAIVFFRRDGDVYRIDPDGGNLRRLTDGNQYVEFRLGLGDKHGSSDPPAISPDGARIAYMARRDGVPQVHVMNLDGTGQRQVTHRPTPCGRVRWSPDGRQLAFVSWTDAFPQLFVVPAEGGEPWQLTHADGAVYWLDWSPGGA